MQVWGLQAVQAVVTFKWNVWARYYLYCELACYLVWLLGFQVFTIIFQVLFLHIAFILQGSHILSRLSRACSCQAGKAACASTMPG